jgi:hypothetical protein
MLKHGFLDIYKLLLLPKLGKYRIINGSNEISLYFKYLFVQLKKASPI